MARELKVYGGRFWVRGYDTRGGRAIIATRTKKRAMEILELSQSEFYNFWCETGNETELKIALAEPETIFFTGDQMRNSYTKIEKEV